MRLAELHAVQALDNNTNALERPQFCTEAVLGRLLQHGPTHPFKLCRVQFRWPTPTRDGTQRTIAQKTVVIPANDAVYVLQINADALKTDAAALMLATDVIDKQTKITP